MRETMERYVGRVSDTGGPELLTVGRVGVDLYPEQDGPLKDVTTFAKFLGGTATNVAVGAARLGRRTAVLTKVGPDGFGELRPRGADGFGVERRTSARPRTCSPRWCSASSTRPRTRRCCSTGRRWHRT